MAPIAGATYAELPIGAIAPNPRQPRTVFDEEALAELVFSIKEIGLLQPIVVRDVGDEQFELIAGERRLRASKEAGLASIPHRSDPIISAHSCCCSLNSSLSCAL